MIYVRWSISWKISSLQPVPSDMILCKFRLYKYLLRLYVIWLVTVTFCFLNLIFITLWMCYTIIIRFYSIALLLSWLELLGSCLYLSSFFDLSITLVFLHKCLVINKLFEDDICFLCDLWVFLFICASYKCSSHSSMQIGVLLHRKLRQAWCSSSLCEVIMLSFLLH